MLVSKLQDVEGRRWELREQLPGTASPLQPALDPPLLGHMQSLPRPQGALQLDLQTCPSPGQLCWGEPSFQPAPGPGCFPLGPGW